MRLHFVRDEIFFIKRDGSRIIFKHRDAKIFLALRFPYFLRRPLDVAAVDAFLHLIERVGKYRVLAVLGPRLSELFQLNVRRISFLLLKMVAYHLQLLQ